LFAINPLGQHTFTKGKETMNLTLETGESVTFNYRILIISGETNADEIEKAYAEFNAN
jgi:hypothetical protein